MTFRLAVGIDALVLELTLILDSDVPIASLPSENWESSFLQVPVICRGGGVLGGLAFGSFLSEHPNLPPLLGSSLASTILGSGLIDILLVLSVLVPSSIGCGSNPFLMPLFCFYPWDPLLL